MQPFISVCMIAKNEEKHIRRCLESIKDFADEIIIVDTGSTDNTIKIIKEFEANIILLQREWKDNFSYSRNLGLDVASGAYIMWIDCDEELIPEAKEKIKEHIKKNRGTAVCLTLGFPSKPDFNDVTQLRIVPNRSDILFEGIIHEQLGNSVERAGVKITYCDAKILHYGYEEEIDVRRKLERNLALLERQLELTPDSVNYWLLLIRNLIDLNRTEEAKEKIDWVVNNTDFKDIKVYFQSMRDILEFGKREIFDVEKDHIDIVINEWTSGKEKCLEAIKKYTTVKYKIVTVREAVMNKAKFTLFIDSDVIVTPYYDINLLNAFTIPNTKYAIVAPVNNLTTGQKVTCNLHFTKSNLNFSELESFSKLVKLANADICYISKVVDESCIMVKNFDADLNENPVIVADAFVYILEDE